VSCLHTSLSCGASDPRDKVFAILGLVQSPARARISIDYMSTMEEVLAQAVFACMIENGNLGLLHYARLSAGEDVATTSCFSEQHFEKFLSQGGIYLMPGKSTDHLMARCKGSIPFTQILPRLLVRARLLDACIESSSHSLEDCFEGPLDDSVTARLGYNTSVDSASHLTDGPSTCDWFRVLDHRMWRNFVDGSYELCIDCKEPPIVKKVIQDLRARSLSPNCASFRTLRTLGFTSGYCMPGDVVSLVEGAPYAMLLRPIGIAKYRIVGECHRWARKRTLLSRLFNSYNVWTHIKDERGFWQNCDRDMRQIVIY
jgi:hypothetical protein